MLVFSVATYTNNKYETLTLQCLQKTSSALSADEVLLYSRAVELDDLVRTQAEEQRYLADQLMRDAAMTEEGLTDGNALSYNRVQEIRERRVAIAERAKALRLMVSLVTGAKVNW